MRHRRLMAATLIFAIFSTFFPGSSPAQQEASLTRPPGPLRPVDPENPACCLSGTCCPSPPERTGPVLMSSPRFFRPEAAQQLSAEVQDRQCFSTLPRPSISVKRASIFYNGSPHFSRCASAAKALLAMRTKTGRYTLTTNEIALTADDRARYGASMLEYGQACLATLSAPEASGLLSGPARSVIENSAGYFYHGSTASPFCTGILVHGKIITARHCFAYQSPGTVNILPNHRFRTFSGNITNLQFSVSEEFEAANPGDLSSDWLVLTPAIDIPKSDLGIRQPLQWDELYIPSFDQRSILAAMLQGTPAPRDHAAQLDLSPLCRVAAYERGIILHACQTEEGFSGSPLLTIDASDRLWLVGIQSGRSEALLDACRSPLKRFFPNYGVALPGDAISRLLGRN
jgi:V8-like Glu-specific endopeptidase